MEEELKKIENLLTPKFNRTCNPEIYHRPVGSCRSKKMWAKVASIAAIFIVACVLGIVAFTPADINAEETVKTSLSNFSKADTYKVSFCIVAKPSLSDEVYTIDPSGEPISGIMYIKYVDQIPKLRFEWGNPEHTVVIYDGENYKRYNNDKLVEVHKSSPIFNLKELTALTTATAKLQSDNLLGKADEKLAVDGHTVTLTVNLNGLLLTGEFSNENKRLCKAQATLKNIKILKTDAIEYGLNLSDSLFE